MPLTGKKRLTIEFNEGAEEETLKDFKKKCIDQGKTVKDTFLMLIRKYTRDEE